MEITMPARLQRQVNFIGTLASKSPRLTFLGRNIEPDDSFDDTTTGTLTIEERMEIWREDELERLAQDTDATQHIGNRPKLPRTRGRRRQPKSAIYVDDFVELSLEYPGHDGHRSPRNHDRIPLKREIVRRARLRAEQRRVRALSIPLSEKLSSHIEAILREESLDADANKIADVQEAADRLRLEQLETKYKHDIAFKFEEDDRNHVVYRHADAINAYLDDPRNRTVEGNEDETFEMALERAHERGASMPPAEAYF